MAFVYANSGSGLSAGGIGWFDFGNLTLNPGQSYTGLTGTLNDGTKITFDIESISSSIVPFTANVVPRPFSFFGSLQYTGILGNVALTTPLLSSYSNNSTINIKNIVAVDANNNPITNFTAVVTDAESTNKFPQYTEHLTFTTDGGPWALFNTIGPNPPTLAGVGSSSVTITGLNQSSQAAYVLTTTSPSNLTLETYGREAVAIGFATTRVTIEKNVGARINSADQFSLNIAGTPNDQVFTTGLNNGIQTEKATIYGTPLNTYTINEAMKAGSVSPLSAYTIATSAVNLTPNGTIPPTGSLPINVTPALGDNIVYTITNAAPETFTKTVDKKYADLGDVLTYTITGHNPNNFVVNNVLVTDSIPAGTTYIPGSLTSSTAISGTAPNTGITILAVAPNSNVTISWKVQVNSTVATNLVNNVASVTVPGQPTVNTNIVTTNINNADLTSNGNFIKTVDKSNAVVGDILTYTITLHNTGNVSANNVIVTDIIPAGTTYVAGSTTSTIPFTGDPTTAINLSSPIGAGGLETITFQVKVNSVPSVNPIPNNASVSYAYTVDPANPNGIAKNGISNTVTTNIINASLQTIKSSDKTVAYLGDIITYNIVVTNTGNVPLNNVLVTDPINTGTSYIPGSLVVSVPSTGTPDTGITLTNSLASKASANITFQVKVTQVPATNPIANQATTNYQYNVNPNVPVNGTSSSNIVKTLIFRNNYTQQINDLIESVALEEAALSAIANQEGAKIQAALKNSNITPQELMCINKSVQDMLDSINTLEAVLKQKLNIVNCQINGCSCC
ncbi:MAG: hypothetical protein RSF67_04790 [Clostridia bacterium]